MSKRNLGWVFFHPLAQEISLKEPSQIAENVGSTTAATTVCILVVAEVLAVASLDGVRVALAVIEHTVVGAAHFELGHARSVADAAVRFEIYLILHVYLHSVSAA
jgi:hypothetical protein